MLSTTVKRTMATALSGAAIAGAIGVPAASARPADAVGAPERAERRDRATDPALERARGR